MAKMVLKDRHCLGPMDRTETELMMHKNKHSIVWETHAGNSYEFYAIYFTLQISLARRCPCYLHI